MTSYPEKIQELLKEIVKHGYGSLTVTTEKLPSKPSVKITIECGKRWIYFERVEFDKDNIL